MTTQSNYSPERDQQTLELFQRFLKVQSTSHSGPSSGSYAQAVALLEEEARKRGFSTSQREMVPGKPILLCSLRGKNESAQSILLNSHYDVVPVEEKHWTLAPPWEGRVVDGWVVGRGTQDMKCVCVQHLEGVYRAAKASPGGQLERTVHVTFVPDEEIGGMDGLGKWVEAGHLGSLNVGCALDEGLANPNKGEFTVFYGERAVWWLRIRASGNAGHGSRFIKNQAVQRVLSAVNRFLAYRAEQESKFEGHEGCKHGVAHKLGDFVTVNCTMLSAGVTSDNGVTYALNTIPVNAEAGFDIRIPPTVDLAEFEAMVRGWCDPDDVSIEFVEKVPEHNVSDISDKSPWWASFTGALKEMGLKYSPEIFPAGTDSRYLRAAGVPAFGFSPIDDTPILLHDHNERLHIDTFTRGTHIMAHIIKTMANAL